jgi:hypothetical protein
MHPVSRFWEKLECIVGLLEIVHIKFLSSVIPTDVWAWPGLRGEPAGQLRGVPTYKGR